MPVAGAAIAANRRHKTESSTTIVTGSAIEDDWWLPKDMGFASSNSLAKRRENGAVRFLVPEGMPPQHPRPIRSETRTLLVASIARGRRWLEELTSDITATAQRIAEREGCSVRKVNMTISLAFLAPNLVKAAIDGRLPHGMGVARLADLPAEWSRQHRILGLPSP